MGCRCLFDLQFLEYLGNTKFFIDGKQFDNSNSHGMRNGSKLISSQFQLLNVNVNVCHKYSYFVAKVDILNMLHSVYMYIY